MAVFTPVTPDDARCLLTRYDLGDLVSLTGISAGIENSNFFLTTTRGDYVLTLFEVLTATQLPFYIGLMHHLASAGLPVPQPQRLRDGSRLTTLHEKPATIVTRLAGRGVLAPAAAHCRLAGEMLARVHLAGRDFALAQPNLRGLAWWQTTAPKVLAHLDAGQRALLSESLAEQVRLAATPDWQRLPAGPAHCDLFRDNVLFTGTDNAPQLGGVIDFYFAGCDTWLFDVAVCVNDWCVDADGTLNVERVQAWLTAYAAVRPFTDAEREAWPTMLRGAALRFWLSRLYDYHVPRPAQTLTPHDPRPFERILTARRDAAPPALP